MKMSLKMLGLLAMTTILGACVSRSVVDNANTQAEGSAQQAATAASAAASSATQADEAAKKAEASANAAQDSVSAADAAAKRLEDYLRSMLMK